MDAGVPQVARIKLKVGSMELEYEGDPSFLTGGIEALLVTMGGLASKMPEELAPSTSPIQTQIVQGSTPLATSTTFALSTNTIAARFEAKTGPELVICAMAQLELVQSKASSTRAEILAEMKSATSYYNDGFSSNLTKTLSNLTKSKRINQITKNIYALSATERKHVEVKVAEIE